MHAPSQCSEDLRLTNKPDHTNDTAFQKDKRPRSISRGLQPNARTTWVTEHASVAWTGSAIRAHAQQQRSRFLGARLLPTLTVQRDVSRLGMTRPISKISGDSLQSKQMSQALCSARASSVQENAKTFPGVLDLCWRASSFPPDPAFRARLECFLASAEWPLQRES
jgi:hypothetical protein